MNISMRKLWAITEVKTKNLFSKNFVTMPLFTVGVMIAMRFIFNSIGEDTEPSHIISYLLNFGLVFNISTMGICVTSTALAEEKEKNTLRTLMTSSVNGLEFFIGSILPVFGLTMMINILLIPISGATLTGFNILVYLVVCTIATLTSCIIGMILGIYAKNQVSSSTICTPALLLFTFVPIFASYLESLENISKFLFTGVLSDMVAAIGSNTSYQLGILQIAVLVIEILLASFLILYIYRKNGFEKE